MKIAELLNGPTAATRLHPEKRMDMPALDDIMQNRLHRSELSMARIIQSLAAKTGSCTHLPHLVIPSPTYKAMLSTHKDTYPSDDEVAKIKHSQNIEFKANCGQTRDGLTPLNESEKRVKQRMLVKRSYYRKIDTLVELRHELETLEIKCKEVIITRRPFKTQPLPLANESQRCEQLREQYTQLSITQDELRYENKKLRLEAMELSKTRTRIGILLNEELQDQNEARAKGASLGVTNWSRATLCDASVTKNSTQSRSKTTSKPVLDFTPISEDECITIVREAYTDVKAFADYQRYEETGAKVFGWRDRRQVDGDTMRFFLEKTFEHLTAKEISSRMWDLVSSERGVNRIYASDVAIQFHLVQRVNDANVLFYRTIEPRGGNEVLKALVLVSRVQVDDNGTFMLLFRSVDPRSRGISRQETFQPLSMKKEIWSDVFSWGLYEAVGESGQHCRNYFGGFVSSLLTQQSLDFWLMHILLIAVRCENEVIGPLFLTM
ncbi:hypothetical protein CCR75_006228 [Bremia lactucae]|uniref:Uncharacterized protein n=1 Tax=Bremia lactucae TaxID=4779 RepID=A0A976P044_BRELC|nr:hypothetical protein CCR75_006228 [Bremia lactucae]